MNYYFFPWGSVLVCPSDICLFCFCVLTWLVLTGLPLFLMDPDTKLIGNMALLPIRSQFKGPAPRESKSKLLSIIFTFWYEKPSDVSTSGKLRLLLYFLFA